MTGTSQLTTFGHLTIEYDDRVLRPRAWTVLQSAWAAELLPRVPTGDVLELCAGAGHIGLLAVDGTSRRLVQVDADEAACDFARANARRAGRDVEVRHGWMEEALRPEERFALVIADPPWVPSGETSAHPEDPLSAIDGGEDGLDAVRVCLEVISRHLEPGGAAVLQVGDVEQARSVAAHVDAHPGLDLLALAHRAADEGALVHLARRS